MLQVTPYYNKPTQDGLYRHFKAIIEAAPLPTVVYNVPGRTGCDLLPDTVARLCEHPAGGGDQGGDRQPAARLADHSPRWAIGWWCCRATTPPPSRCSRWAPAGVISVVSNVAPAEFSAMWDAFAAGDWIEARELHYRLFPLSEGLFVETNPIPVKAALAMMGKIADEIRPPLYPLTGANREKVAQDPRRPRSCSPWPMSDAGAHRRPGRRRQDGPGHRARAGRRARGRTLAAAVERPGARRAGPGRGPAGRAGRQPGGPAARSCPRAGEADVWIDFSAAARPRGHTPRPPPTRGAALVLGTTGLPGARPRARSRHAARRVPVVLSPNMSVGVNVLLRLVADAARALGPGYDIEIVEAHHRTSATPPRAPPCAWPRRWPRPPAATWTETARYERHGDIGPRTAEEIGLQTIRGGDVVGDHTVFFLGLGERIEITHRASSRETFARGAVRAALWLAGRHARPVRHARRARALRADRSAETQHSIGATLRWRQPAGSIRAMRAWRERSRPLVWI